MCSVEGGKPKGSPAFSGNNKPKKIFRGDSMEQSREVSPGVGGDAGGSIGQAKHSHREMIFLPLTRATWKQVTNRELETGEIWIQYNFAPRAVMVHKFHFSRPVLNVTSSPSSYQLLGFGRNGNAQNGWNFIHRFQGGIAAG